MDNKKFLEEYKELCKKHNLILETDISGDFIVKKLSDVNELVGYDSLKIKIERIKESTKLYDKDSQIGVVKK